jgi:predicted  nucleic acid-binding Zn-ribbon protein
MYQKACTHCHTLFTAKRSDATACSTKCRMALSRAKQSDAQRAQIRTRDAQAHRDAYQAAVRAEESARVARWAFRESHGMNQSDALERI